MSTDHIARIAKLPLVEKNNPCPIHETSCLDCRFGDGRSCTWGKGLPRKWDSEEMTRIKALEGKVEALRQRIERIDGEEGRGEQS